MRLFPGILIGITILALFAVQNQASAASIYKDRGVGVSIEKSALLSGKIKYLDLVPFDNSTSYSGEFIKKGDDVRRHTISYHNNIGPYQFSKKYYIIVDPPSAIQNRLPLITIVSNLDSYHTDGQMKTNEYKIAPDAKAKSVIIQSNTLRWVDEGCREAKITVKQWQVLLPDTIRYLKSGCDGNYTSINTISNYTKILTNHDLKTSSKHKLQSFYDMVKKNCLQKFNSCGDMDNRAVNTMGDSR